jgi:hypothetical protein
MNCFSRAKFDGPRTMPSAKSDSAPAAGSVGFVAHACVEFGEPEVQLPDTVAFSAHVEQVREAPLPEQLDPCSIFMLAAGVPASTSELM